MAIAQLTHLHLTIPSSGSTSEPVPSECYLVVPLSRESAISRRVSFARDVAVLAAFFSGRGAGVSYSTDEKGQGATPQSGSYTVYPAGLRVVSQ